MTDVTAMTAEIFDSHAHYDSSAFDGDRDEVLIGLKSRGVCGVINCATDLETARISLSLAEKYPFIYAAVGMQPQEITASGGFKEEDFLPLLSHEKCLAVGEIGLEYHYDCAPKEVQLDIFSRQLDIARRVSLPVIVHDREAHADTLRLLQKHRVRGVVHCFSGSVEMMREVVKMGMYIGLGGAVTFKNARVPLEVAKNVPIDRLLLETDCPYMTPAPHRGERNDSSLIRLTAERIAEVRNMSADEAISASRENVRALFGV